MAKLKTEALKPGMVLAKDLKHNNGRFLLAKGVILDSSHFRILRIWGIDGVEVEDCASSPSPESVVTLPPQVIQKAEETVRERFAFSDMDHPLTAELFRICSLREAHLILLNPSPFSKETEVPLAPLPHEKAFFPPSEDVGDPNTLVSEHTSLASLPNIFMEINHVLSDPRSSAIHIADIISKDPNLSAKLLKIVNSAFYNFPSRIDTISRAVMIVGSKQLMALALGTSVMNMFTDIPSELVDMKSFRKHSLACGLGSRMIASYKNIPNTERLFVAGLLHDVGRIVLFKHLPQLGRSILLTTKQRGCLLGSVESEVLGFGHAQIGGALLRKWKLPLVLEHAVQYHHQPLLSQYPLESSIVNFSDILINALKIGTSGEHRVPPIDPEVWKTLDFPTANLSKIIQLIDRQIEEVTHKFFGEC
jgi:HD-like signal output (HDOD) protein